MLRSPRSELINLQIFFALEGLERRFFDDEALEACKSREGKDTIDNCFQSGFGDLQMGFLPFIEQMLQLHSLTSRSGECMTSNVTFLQ